MINTKEANVKFQSINEEVLENKRLCPIDKSTFLVYNGNIDYETLIH